MSHGFLILVFEQKRKVSMTTSKAKTQPEANIQVTVGDATLVATEKALGAKLRLAYDVIMDQIIKLLPQAATKNLDAKEARILLNEIDPATGNIAMVKLSEVFSHLGFVVHFAIAELPGTSDALTGLTIIPGEKGWQMDKRKCNSLVYPVMD